MTNPAPTASKCPECDGRGEVLDAPSNVLAGRPYWTPCPECFGTGLAPAHAWTGLMAGFAPAATDYSTTNSGDTGGPTEQS
jgi:hypothetical protein